VQRPAPGGIARDHGGLERRRGEDRRGGRPRRAADRVADADLLQPGDHGDLAGPGGVADDGSPGLEHLDGGDAALPPGAEHQPVADGDPAREDRTYATFPARGAALHLEDRCGHRRGRIVAGRRQERRDAVQELGDPGTGHRRPESTGGPAPRRPARRAARSRRRPARPRLDPTAASSASSWSTRTSTSASVKRVLAVRGPGRRGPRGRPAGPWGRPAGEALADRRRARLGVRAGAIRSC
jgi:hypothetical protein